MRFQVVSQSKDNPEREVVRFQFQTREQAEAFVKSIKIKEIAEEGDVQES